MASNAGSRSRCRLTSCVPAWLSSGPLGYCIHLIYDAINRTKQEIAVLHGKSFNGDEMAKVTGELGAVVGGTSLTGVCPSSS